MIYKLDHVGITVPSLAQARRRLEGFHPCFHVQEDIKIRDALSEVSLRRPERLSISLHNQKGPIGVELIEYPRVVKRRGSMLAWEYSLGKSLVSLKRSIRGHIDLSFAGDPRADAVSWLEAHDAFNAVVVPVTDLTRELPFWRQLRFEELCRDDELAVYGLKSLLPPGESRYLLFYRVERSLECYTDMEGLNEIALLCTSCSADLKAFPLDVFKSSIDTVPVNGREISLGYLRSPGGVLAELFSVRLPAHG